MKKITGVFKALAFVLVQCGFDPRKLKNIGNLGIYLKHYILWTQSGGVVSRSVPVITDFTSSAGNSRGCYFHQDLIAAQKIFAVSPNKHIDVGSRIDGFVANVASFREIEVFDIRPYGGKLAPNIKFVQADLMCSNLESYSDSVSCLHALEHFGLGRYGDTISIDGHIIGFSNIMNLLTRGGRAYLSYPVSACEVIEFNSQRIFTLSSIHKMIKAYGGFVTLVDLTLISDDGVFFTGLDVPENINLPSPCVALYELVKR